ncbi:Uncharacterized protein HZ326_20089 [Fusarium oxysporum f. sp. albedinis]|jgi:hypothetical protein|nr:Uncharacterized protein HZ326_20089 [Fusarium oxysporum f. sp. albedinis]
MDEEFINRTDGDLPETMNDSLKGLGQVPQLRPLEPTKQKFSNVTLKFRVLILVYMYKAPGHIKRIKH